jgi:START domain
MRENLLIGLIWAAAQPVFSQQDCVLKKDQDSIKVYSCKAEGSSFRAIRATFSLRTSRDRLVHFILDIDSYKNWQYNTMESRVLKKVNDTQLVYYTEIAAPWPVSNRDMIVDMEIADDPATGETSIIGRSKPDFIPEVKGLVRVPISYSKWTIRRGDAGTLNIDYYIEIDPGGSVPAWIMNMVAAQAPHDSFKNLRAKIQGGK